MKFLKKTAALLFCVALALSVMAVSAMAAPVIPPEFTLTLGQVSSFTHHDDDADSAIEVASNSTITYNLNLKSSVASQAVNSFSFKIDTIEGVTTAVTFYNGASSDSTVAAAETSYTGGKIYSFTSNATPENDFPLTTANEDVTIGQVSFTVSNTVNHQTIAPELKGINLTTRIAGEYYSDKIDVSTVSAKIQVNPVYSITLKNFTADTTTGQLPKSADGAYTPDANGDVVLYYDYEGTIYSAYTPGTYTTGTASKLDVAPVITAYEYATGFTTSGWKVTTVPINMSSGWTANLPQNDIDTFNDHRVGNVVLTAQYSPIVYNYGFVYNGPTISGATGATGTYTIEAPVMLPTDPEWTGYNFKGWSAAKGSAFSEPRGYNDDIWKVYTSSDSPDYNYVEGETRNSNLITSLTTNKVYGDVVLTAVWDEDGEFASADYGYANRGDVIMLYAVKSGTEDNYSETDTYQFNGNNMFIVSDKYISSFTLEQQTALGNDYVIYAYIAAATDNQKAKVSITKDGGKNTEIAYDGNVYRGADGTATGVNTADYGNVDALLAAGGGTVRASELDAVTMRARLEADVVRAGDTLGTATVPAYNEQGTTDGELKYASIWDIKAIIANLT